MVAQALRDLVADPHDRVERVFRVLQHHADPAAAQVAPLGTGGTAQVEALELHSIGGDNRGRWAGGP